MDSGPASFMYNIIWEFIHTGFVTVNETFVFVSDFLETLLQQNPLFFLFRKHLYGL